VLRWQLLGRNTLADIQFEKQLRKRTGSPSEAPPPLLPPTKTWKVNTHASLAKPVPLLAGFRRHRHQSSLFGKK
jgi:hypothetical protein